MGSIVTLGPQEANLVEEVEDSPDFWSGLVQSQNSPVDHRFSIGLDRSTNGPLPECDRKYVSVRTMPPEPLRILDIHCAKITKTDPGMVCFISCLKFTGPGVTGPKEGLWCDVLFL